MKKCNVILVTFLFIFAGFNLSAQDEESKDSGLFVRVNGGYGFEGIHTVSGVDQDGGTMSKNIYGSSAPGFNVGIGVGYMFNKYFGLELGAYYMFGKSKFSEVRAEGLPLGFVGGTTELNILNATILQKYTHQSKQFRLTPSVIVRGGNGKIAPYAKVGLVIPVAGKTYTDVEGSLTTTEIPTSIFGIPIPGFDDGVSLAGSVDAEAESFGLFSVGFDATLGIDVKVTNLISVFAEVNMTALTIKSKETLVKKYDGTYALVGSPLTLDDLADGINTAADLANLIPGVDLGEFSFNSLGLYENIDEVPLYESHIIYVDELDTSSNNEFFNPDYSQEEPMDDLARRDNFSSIGINIGVKFSF